MEALRQDSSKFIVKLVVATMVVALSWVLLSSSNPSKIHVDFLKITKLFSTDPKLDKFEGTMGHLHIETLRYKVAFLFFKHGISKEPPKLQKKEVIYIRHKENRCAPADFWYLQKRLAQNDVSQEDCVFDFEVSSPSLIK